MKNATRIKQTTTISRDEMETALGELVGSTLNKQRLVNTMDGMISTIRQQFQSNIDECDEAIQEMTKIVKSWALTHPEEFAKRKSLDFVQATIGFRTGTPKLKALPGWNWDMILGAVDKHEPSFVRVITEVDKEALIQQREILGAEKLAKLGIKVVQEESFFIAPKLTQVDTRATAETSKAA